MKISYNQKKTRHTEIIDSKIAGELKIIQVNTTNFPKGKSNIYALNNEEKIVWYAELPLKGDNYPNPIQWDKSLNEKATSWDDFYIDNPYAFSVSSSNGYTVSISYNTGKILQSEFTK